MNMKTLILVGCSLFAFNAAQQPAAPPSTTAKVATSSDDALRVLKIIDLRDLLKSDLEGTFSTGMYTTTTGTWMVTAAAKPPEPKEPPAETTSVRAAPAKSQADDPDNIARRATAWQEMLTLWIRPALLTGHDTLQVTRDGTLIANLTDEAHAWLDRFLALQRESKYMVNLQLDFITGPRGAFERFTSGGAGSVLALDDAKKLVADARAGGNGTKLVSSTPLVGWVRFTNHVSELIPTSYVKDWRVATVEPGHKPIAVPEIDTVQDGELADVRAVPLDATHVGLEIDATHSTVFKPIRTQKVKLDIEGGREVEIALVEVTKVTLKSQISLELGGYALFTGPSDPDNMVAVLVHVDRQKPGTEPVMQTFISTKKKGTPDKH
jgi:hypothetical protein